MAGVTALRKIQLGVESTAGTAVAATTVWRGMGMLADDREVSFVDEQIGIATPTNRAYIPKESATVTFDSVEATFLQLCYILEAGIEAATASQDGAGSDYIRAYNLPTTAVNSLKTFTIEGGNNELVQETDYCYVESFKISGTAGEGVMMEATLKGRSVTDASFTGSISIPVITPGDHIVFGGSNFYIDPTSTYPATTEVTGTLLSFDLDVTTGINAKWTNAGKDFDFTYFNRGAFSATLNMVYEHNATTDTERDAFEAATARAVRLKFNGPAVATPGTTYSNKHLIIDAAGTYTEFPFGDLDGNQTIEAVLQIGYDVTATAAMDITVVNEISDLYTNPPA